MNFRNGRRDACILVLCAVVLAGASGGTGETPDWKLVRIDPSSASISEDMLGRFRCVREIGVIWLAVVRGEDAAGMLAAGVPVDVLDEAPDGKAYFLVRLANPADAAALGGYGTARVLDAHTALFWSGSREARPLLPERFAIARLFLDPDAPRPSLAPTPEAASAGGRPHLAAEAEDSITAWAAEVSKANLIQTISDLQSFQTRYATTAGCASAAAYVHDRLTATGLPTEYDDFIWGANYSGRNVVATLTGKTRPEQIVIICAHYDSFSNQRLILAPGADDNASGVAAVIESARILAGKRFDFTIQFIAFSAEEVGLYGSRHFAQAAKAEGAEIRGVINLDMIGYVDAAPEDLELFVDTNSSWLADRFIAAAGRYAPIPTAKRVDSSMVYSDHSPFWNAGYAALCGIEDGLPLPNPYYHKTTDVLSTLDMDFALAASRASLATAADLAQPIFGPAAPADLRAGRQLNRSLYAHVKTVVLSWTPGDDTAVGYHVYRSDSRHTGYARLTSAPIAERSYADRFLDPQTSHYYVVTAVDAEGREGNASVEVRDI